MIAPLASKERAAHAGRAAGCTTKRDVVRARYTRVCAALPVQLGPAARQLYRGDCELGRGLGAGAAGRRTRRAARGDTGGREAVLAAVHVHNCVKKKKKKKASGLPTLVRLSSMVVSASASLSVSTHSLVD